jgi:hypothetical protein
MHYGFFGNVAVGKEIILKAYLHHLCTYIVELGGEVWSAVSRIDSITLKVDVLGESC